MDKKLFNILACPICKSEVFLSSVSDLTFVELVAEEKPQKSEKCKLPTEEEFLVCKACQLAYPVRDDIPVMLESDAWQIKKSEYKSR